MSRILQESTNILLQEISKSLTEKQQAQGKELCGSIGKLQNKEDSFGFSPQFLE